jgi:hypothetical protein
VVYKIDLVFFPFLLFVLLLSLDGLMVDSRPVAYLNSTVAEVTMVSSTKNCCFFLTSIAKDAIEAGIKKSDGLAWNLHVQRINSLFFEIEQKEKVICINYFTTCVCKCTHLSL